MSTIVNSSSDNSVKIIEELTVYVLTSTLIKLMSCWVFGSSLRKATSVRRVCFSRRNLPAVKKKKMAVHDKYEMVFNIVNSNLLVSFESYRDL